MLIKGESPCTRRRRGADFRCRNGGVLLWDGFLSCFAFQLFRHSCSLRELSQVRGTSFSGGEGITLLPAESETSYKVKKGFSTCY